MKESRLFWQNYPCKALQEIIGHTAISIIKGLHCTIVLVGLNILAFAQFLQNCIPGIIIARLNQRHRLIQRFIAFDFGDSEFDEKDN